MKTYLLTLILGFCCFSLFSQPARNIVVKCPVSNTSVNIDTLVGVKNKPVLFNCDTVFLINEYGVSEFVRCAYELNRIKNEIPAQLDMVSGDLSSIKTGVDSMYVNMKSVTAFINDYEKETRQKLEHLSDDNTQLTNNLVTIQKQLEEARQQIKNERWKSMGTKALWGAGGFAVGGLLFTGLMLLN
jgi:hypothetical protein